jgi:glycosyltransferase involved in cell wall biosynthesis
MVQIYFVTKKAYAKWEAIESLDAGFIDRTPDSFRSGVDGWIAQTYLRVRDVLQTRGIFVSFVARFVPGQICVAHRDDLNDYSSFALRSFVVGVRADRPPLYICDREVVQNNLEPDTPYRRFLPLWPMPGLRPRNASRGERILRLAYLGRDSSAPGWFRDPAFHAALGRLGVDFQVRTSAWHDYSDVDILLAHREELPSMLRLKPATKLYNAWLAGTPALLGDEPAYAALRRNELDFIAIASPQDVLAATSRLISNPALYRAMIENGHSRAREFSPEAITSRWTAYFCDEIIPAYLEWIERSKGIFSSVRRERQFIARMTAQKIAAKLFRRKIVVSLAGPLR